jgi:hypothetical protein
VAGEIQESRRKSRYFVARGVDCVLDFWYFCIPIVVSVDVAPDCDPDRPVGALHEVHLWVVPSVKPYGLTSYLFASCVRALPASPVITHHELRGAER